jgi:hypothetical protein
MIAQATPVSQERAWSQVIARVWADEDFKQRLLLDPRGVLAENDIELPPDVDINVVEDSATVRHVVLPPPPSDELTDEELVGKDAAYCFCGACGRCGCGCGGCFSRCD